MKVSFVALRGKSGEHHHYQARVFLSNNFLDLYQFKWDLVYLGTWVQRLLVNNGRFLLFVCNVLYSFPA